MNYAKSSFLIILSAPSGGGKTTLLNEVLQRTDNIDYSISYTTRAPRGEEQSGVHYHFVDEKEFERRIHAGDFLEHAYVFDKYYYGTSISFIKSRLALGRHVIMDIDVQGAAQISQGQIPFVKIFIIPPDMATLKKRLIERGTDDMSEIQRRLGVASDELKNIPEYDYLVINDDLKAAVEDIIHIIRAEEIKSSRYINPAQSFLKE